MVFFIFNGQGSRSRDRKELDRWELNRSRNTPLAGIRTHAFNYKQEQQGDCRPSPQSCNVQESQDLGLVSDDQRKTKIWSSSLANNWTRSVYLKFCEGTNWQFSIQVQVQVELYCHSATCGDIQWNEMSCLTGPRCYINTDIQQWSKTL